MSRFELLNDAEEVLLEDADKFEPYPNEKIRLKLHTGEKYEQLKTSIIANGIMQPVIAMPSTNRGMLVSIAGANRIKICTELGIKVPYQLKTNLTQEQADSICIDTNLLNRQQSDLLPSELGWMLRTKWEINNKQGERNDLKSTSCNDCTKSQIEEEFKIKKRSILMYIRLTYLTDELLKMVDDKIISLVNGVSLSYLKQLEMQSLYEYITKNNYNVTSKIAEELKKLSQSTEDNINIYDVLGKLNKPEEKHVKMVKFNSKELSSIIPKEDLSRSKEIIIDLLKQYYNIA